MDHRHCIRWLALTSTIYLCFMANITSARPKCRGKWTLMACLGGNGKRSNQEPLLLEDDNKDFDATKLIDNVNLHSNQGDYQYLKSDSNDLIMPSVQRSKEASTRIQLLNDILRQLVYRRKLQHAAARLA